MYYHPPGQDSDIDDIMLREISQYCGKKNLIILGDFNAPFIDWKLLTTNCLEKNFNKKLLNTTLDNLLTQHVNFPTRFREGQQSNCLDLILTKCDDNIDKLSSEAPLGNSDHNVISCEYVLFSAEKSVTLTKKKHMEGIYRWYA